MEKNIDDIVEEKVQQGAIWSLLYLDLHADNEETLNNILVGIIQNITKEKGVEYCFGVIQKPEKDGDLYSTSAEVKLLTEDFYALQRVCLLYNPVYLEILKPEEIRLKGGEAESLIMNAVSITQELTQHVLMSQLQDPKQKEKYRKKIEKRKEIGKRLLEKNK